MTKKDFQLIADVLARFGPLIEPDRGILLRRMAEALATTNPRFDKQKFIAACNK